MKVLVTDRGNKISYSVESSLTVNLLLTGGGDLSANHLVWFAGYGGVSSNAVRDIERCVLLSKSYSYIRRS